MKFACLFLTLVAILPVSAPASFAEQYTAEEFVAFSEEVHAAKFINDGKGFITVREDRIKCLRDAIDAHGDHPLNLILEGELLLSLGPVNPADRVAANAERRALLDSIIERYRNVDYYEYLDPRLALRLDFLLPEMVSRAAWDEFHANRNFDNFDSARAGAIGALTITALDYVALTVERRRKAWPALTAADTPDDPPPSEEVLAELKTSRSGYVSAAVKRGIFLDREDLLCIRALLNVYTNCAAIESGNPGEVALSEIAKRYAGTAIEKVANQLITESLKHATDRFDAMAKTGRVLDDVDLAAPVDDPDETAESETGEALKESTSDSVNAPAFESDTTDLDAGQGMREGGGR